MHWASKYLPRLPGIARCEVAVASSHVGTTAGVTETCAHTPDLTVSALTPPPLLLALRPERAVVAGDSGPAGPSNYRRRTMLTRDERTTFGQKMGRA